MVTVAYEPRFERTIKKIKDKSLKAKIKKQIKKIIENPLAGKPMKYARKNTREVHISPYRLSYEYKSGLDKIVLLDLYHKDEQ